MAFFTFRKKGDDATSQSAPNESVEAIRRRAKHRLLGAAILLVAGVIGFPLVFDSQPRPVAVDIPIEIPDKAKVKSLVMVPEAKVSDPGREQGVITETREEGGLGKPAAVPEVAAPVVAAKAERQGETKMATRNDARSEGKAEADVKPPAIAAKEADGKGKAMKEVAVKEPAKEAAAEGRFVVQVGAFADPGKAREVRLKVERLGIKTYTQDVQTKDGSRIRVRVGPFAGRADADKAAAKIKKADLAAAVLSL